MTAEDVDYCNGRALVIAINDNYKLAPWADVLYACDLKWWQWHDGVPEFTGRKVTQDKAAADKYGIEYIESAANKGLSLDPALIHQGGNSGYQAINVAYHMGVDRVVLLGYDMQLNGRAHWFGDHPDGIRSTYAPWPANYQTIADQNVLEIINCTRTTALHCFKKMSLESALS